MIHVVDDLQQPSYLSYRSLRDGEHKHYSIDNIDTHTIYMYIVLVIHVVDYLQQPSDLSYSSPRYGEHKHYSIDYRYSHYLRVMLLLLFVRVLHRFQQCFCHITTVSGCDRELSAHFYSAASLKYHAPDT